MVRYSAIVSLGCVGAWIERERKYLGLGSGDGPDALDYSQVIGVVRH